MSHPRSYLVSHPAPLQKGSKYKASLIMALSGAALLSLAYVAYATGLLASPVKLDKQTFCRLDAPVQKSSLILLDYTDPPTPAQIDRVKARAHNVATASEDHDKLIVAVLNPDDPTAPRVVFSRCAPRSPTRTPWILAGEVILRKDWTKNFDGPLMAAISEASTGTPPAARSPIIATVTALTQRPDFDASIRERQLIVVSDLLEHDPKVYSQIKGGDLAAPFRRSVLVRSWPDLHGVPVTVEYLQRTDPASALVQSKAHRDFWKWWFTTAGASGVEFFGVTDAPELPPLRPVNAPASQPTKPRKASRAKPCHCR